MTKPSRITRHWVQPIAAMLFCLIFSSGSATSAPDVVADFELQTLSTVPAHLTPLESLSLDTATRSKPAATRPRDCNIKIFNTDTGEFISRRELLAQIDPQATVVLGEFHYNENIQNAEAVLIRLLGNNTMPVAWEFLEFPDQAFHSKIFQLYSEGRLRSAAVTDLQFPVQPNGSNVTYNPVMHAIKHKETSIVATNSPRPVKQQLMDFGYETIAEEFKPPLFSIENASDDYFQRFFDALGGGVHPLPRPIEAYFAAQFYTDEVIAWQAQAARILIVGTFHSDFNDGIIPRIPVYSGRPVSNIKVVDGELFSPGEIEEFLHGSAEYGAYADYVVVSCGDAECQW